MSDELNIIISSLFTRGENKEVKVLRGNLPVKATVESSNKEVGFMKGSTFISKGSGVCTLTAKFEDSVGSIDITVMENMDKGNKASKVKDVLIDTSMFAVLNPDMFILCLIILSCIVFASIITLIFVKEITVMKILTGLITAIVTFLLAVAKAIMPKGKVSKELEIKYFPQGDKFLQNTSEFLRKKK